MKIAVIDGQGGGLGKAIIEKLMKVKIHEKADIFALGTNGVATSAMKKAGAAEGASGEITPGMSAAVLESPACKILIPLKRRFLDEMVQRVSEFIDSKKRP